MTPDTQSETCASPRSPFAFRVLVKMPEMLHIPVFALGVEQRRATIEQSLDTSEAALRTIVSGNVARALLTDRYGSHHVVRVRMRTARQTALHSDWVAFESFDQARSFALDHSGLGLDAIEARTAAALADSEARLREGLAAGRFDLSRFDAVAGRKRAREYVELFDAIERLRLDRRALTLVRQHMPDRSDQVSVSSAAAIPPVSRAEPPA